MGPRLNIAAIARRTGVAPDTLRKWESRYGVLRPERTEGGQRRYSEQDVARVEWLRDRLAEGWRIGEAARLLDETSAPPLADPGELRDALRRASAEDPQQVGPLLDQAFTVLPQPVALQEVVAPVMRWIGDEWHAGRLSIAHEHAVTSRVRAKLEQLLADARGGVRGTAVLACAPGELHDLGLLMLAVALRADGWRVEYLGASTPVDQALDFARSLDAALVCLSTSRADTATALTDGLARRELDDGVTVAIGGPAATPETATSLGVLHANGTLDAVVGSLRSAGT
jgi:methanogenic corrinoid protein MtbC1/transposase-like protein